jgi:hypothetical protein
MARKPFEVYRIYRAQVVRCVDVCGNAKVRSLETATTLKALIGGATTTNSTGPAAVEVEEPPLPSR